MIDPDQRQRMLERALREFDRAHARRRTWRRATGAGAALALAAAAALAAWTVTHRPAAPEGMIAGGPSDGASGDTAGIHGVPGGATTPAVIAARGLPAYVHVIESLDELERALDEAGACEGVGRDGDRVFIVECASPATTAW